MAIVSIVPDMTQLEDAIRFDLDDDADEWPCLGWSSWSPETDAYTIWSKVNSLYDAKSTYSAINAYQSIIDFRLRDGEGYVAWQNGFNARILACNKALVKDKPLPSNAFGEGFKAAILLKSLPKSMSVDIRILMAKNDLVPESVRQLGLW